MAVERAALKELKIDVDPKLTILSVTGQEIAQWKESAFAKPAGNGKTLTITFGAESDAERTIDIIAERDVPDAGGESKFARLPFKARSAIADTWAWQPPASLMCGPGNPPPTASV